MMRSTTNEMMVKELLRSLFVQLRQFNILIGMMALLCGGQELWAVHGGTVIKMDLDSDQGNQVVLEWDDSGTFVGAANDSDPPWGQTLDISNEEAVAPAFRFSGGIRFTPDMTFSIELTTPLLHWNHLAANPSWGSTQQGEFMEIHKDRQEFTDPAESLIAVVTDDTSTLPDVDDFSGSNNDNFTQVLNYLLRTPDGNGGSDAGGSLGAYGFGVRVHLWQENFPADGTIKEDFGFSDPIFLTFRNRPLGGTPSEPPAGWMSEQAFASAVLAGQQMVVPEPQAVAILLALITPLFAGRKRHCGG